MVITIDGTSASGKTSAAERLAESLDFHLLKTGAMYRAAGLLMRDAGIEPLRIPPATRAGVAAAWPRMVFDMPVGGQVILNGRDFTDRIEAKEAGELASVIGLFPEVREKLVAEQRRIADGWDIVCEGRDQGTAVFPMAEVKFYIDGDVTVRAKRRLATAGSWPTSSRLEEARRAQQDVPPPRGPLYPPRRPTRSTPPRWTSGGILAFMLTKVAECR